MSQTPGRQRFFKIRRALEKRHAVASTPKKRDPERTAILWTLIIVIATLLLAVLRLLNA